MLLIGSPSAMWAWWCKQFHEPKCGSRHVCRVMAWTRQQGLVPYICFEKIRGLLMLLLAAVTNLSLLLFKVILESFYWWIYAIFNAGSWIVKSDSLSKSVLVCATSWVRSGMQSARTLKKESYLWYIGTFHCAHVGKSIPWMEIGCWQRSVHISVYIYWLVCIELQPILILSAKWMLYKTLGLVSAIIIIVVIGGSGCKSGTLLVKVVG